MVIAREEFLKVAFQDHFNNLIVNVHECGTKFTFMWDKDNESDHWPMVYVFCGDDLIFKCDMHCCWDREWDLKNPNTCFDEIAKHIGRHK